MRPTPPIPYAPAPIRQMSRSRSHPERFILDCATGAIAPYAQDAMGGYPSIGGTEFHNYSDPNYYTSKGAWI